MSCEKQLLIVFISIFYCVHGNPKLYPSEQYCKATSVWELAKSFFADTEGISREEALAFSDKFDKFKDIIFEFHTPKGVLPIVNGKYLSKYIPLLLEHGFRGDRETKVFAHGFWGEAPIICDYAAAYHNLGDYNVFGVNWTAGSSTTINYLEVREYVDTVSSFNNYYLAGNTDT